MKNIVLAFFMLYAFTGNTQEREIQNLDHWKFIDEDAGNFSKKDFDDSNWNKVNLPHDWAIEGEFDFAHDIQLTMVIQDGERKPDYRNGRTGALPFIGIGWYRTNIDITASELNTRKIQLLFCGAMSSSQLFINGVHVGDRPNGYIPFYYDITPFLKEGENTIAIRLENFNSQSRWYPGAGLYREVSLIKTNKTHIKTWGTFVTTPEVSENSATVNCQIDISGNGEFQLKNEILDNQNSVVASETDKLSIHNGQLTNVSFKIEDPKLWDIESPILYKMKTTILKGGVVIDDYITPFGIRKIEFKVDGFYLNGKRIQFQGVNMHHDLGPIGAAFYPNLFERQVKKLKKMGVNAIRFSHNPPASKALDICDEYGILAIDEAFDEWQIGKVRNGYSKHFDDWAEKDLTNMILRDRNHPSVIMWSIGNEIMEQYKRDPNDITSYLNTIVKSLDTTRATTAGFNSARNALESGMALTVDVAGFNYKPGIYGAIRANYPDLKFYASETGGSVSTRNSYKFPVVFDTIHDKRGASLNTTVYPDGQPGNFEYTNVPWGYPPVKEFASLEKNQTVYGEFVWTGYDYLGEPSPYHNAQARSSYFAPIDIVGLEKDKFYLYQSHWQNKKEVLHFFPHWTWPELEQKEIPVVCYTTYPKAELFVNGKSYGIKTKEPLKELSFETSNLSREASGGGTWDLLKAYALVWKDVHYEPGEIKIVAYDENGKTVATEIKNTAGKPAKIEIQPEETTIKNGEVGVYVISVVDEDGNLCPQYQESIDINVSGAGDFMACGNGDPTNLETFTKPERKLFRGQAVIYVKGTSSGIINLSVSSGKMQHTNHDLKVN